MDIADMVKTLHESGALTAVEHDAYTVYNIEPTKFPEDISFYDFLFELSKLDGKCAEDGEK